MKIGDTHTSQVRFTQADFDRFADLSGDDNPIHVDPAFAARTKFGRTVAHGMLLYSTLIRIMGEAFPGPGSRQLTQELMFPSPTFAGENLNVVLEAVGQPFPDTIELTTRIFRPSGELGCTGKTLTALPGCSPEEINLPVRNLPSASPDHESGAAKLHGLALGRAAENTYQIEPEDHRTYLQLLSEQNPLYTDSGYAQNMGFRDVLLTGGELGGMISHLLGTQLPGPGTNWLKQQFEFIKPVYPGEPITGRVQITRLRPEKDLVNLTTRHLNQAGELLVCGEALVWISDLQRRTDAQD
jgi:acyl dehydratase